MHVRPPMNRSMVMPQPPKRRSRVSVQRPVNRSLVSPRPPVSCRSSPRGGHRFAGLRDRTVCPRNRTCPDATSRWSSPVLGVLSRSAVRDPCSADRAGDGSQRISGERGCSARIRLVGDRHPRPRREGLSILEPCPVRTCRLPGSRAALLGARQDASAHSFGVNDLGPSAHGHLWACRHRPRGDGRAPINEARSSEWWIGWSAAP